MGRSAPPVGRAYDGALSDDAVPAYSDGLQFPTDDCPRHDDALHMYNSYIAAGKWNIDQAHGEHNM